MTKQCPYCKEIKELNQFNKRKSSHDGLQFRCRMCQHKINGSIYAVKRGPIKQDSRQRFNQKRHYQKCGRANDLKRKYNITMEQYNQMLEQQNNVCMICKSTETAKNGAGGIRALSVDHCHKTSKVRGLLCRSCNAAIGLIKEDTTIAHAIISYIESHNARSS